MMHFLCKIRSYCKFLITVVNKLFEFMYELEFRFLISFFFSFMFSIFDICMIFLD